MCIYLNSNVYLLCCHGTRAGRIWLAPALCCNTLVFASQKSLAVSQTDIKDAFAFLDDGNTGKISVADFKVRELVSVLHGSDDVSPLVRQSLPHSTLTCQPRSSNS